ncbi:hypothetical protein Y032_0258g422 [Ancylostoma ceylanicum]|nr:hypothetical protein Y032_0258g422 [Ancylostoma ceylanicum]
MPVLQIESEKVKTIRENNYAGHLWKESEMRPRIFLGDVFPHRVYDYADTQYLVDIIIGKPSVQKFRVILDTASSNTWIPDKQCNDRTNRKTICDSPLCDFGLMCKVFCMDAACCIRSNPCEKKTRFHQGRSLTYVGTDGNWEIKNFMDGSVAGFFGNDTVQLGSSYYGDGELVVPGAIFGQAVKVPKSFASHPAEGVVGMGFQSLAVGSFTPPLLRAIHLGLLDQQVFTVFLRRAEGGRDGVDGGLVTYGGVDSKNCDSVIVYEPLTEPAYWQFKLSAVSSGNFTSEDGWSVISDTSSALIVAPLTIAVRLASIFGAEHSAAEAARNIALAFGTDSPSERTVRCWFAKFSSGDLDLEDKPGRGRRMLLDDQALSAEVEAKPDTTTPTLAAGLGAHYVTVSKPLAFIGMPTSSGDYIVKCDTKAELHLTIGKHTYAIVPENMVIPIKNETCLLALRGIPTQQFGPTWIIGDPFIRQYCHIYDIGKEQIGFAKSFQR